MDTVKDDRKLHFVIVLNPLTDHHVIWFESDDDGAKLVFEGFKKIAKEVGDQLLICDGQLYQYDRGFGRWTKQRWENVIFEKE